MNSLETFHKIFPTLSKGTRALFVFLFKFDRTCKGNIYPGQAYISKNIRLSTRQIRRATQKLCELGWIGVFAKHRQTHKYFVDESLKSLKFDENGMPKKLEDKHRNFLLKPSPKMSPKKEQNFLPSYMSLSLDKCFTPPKEEKHFEKAKATQRSDLEILPHLRRVPGINLQQMGFLSQRYSQAAMMCALESMESKKRKGENIRSSFGYLHNAAMKISNDYGYALRRF